MARPLVEAVDRLDPSVDLSGLVLLLSGGAILSPAVKRALAEKLPNTAGHRRLRIVGGRWPGPDRSRSPTVTCPPSRASASRADTTVLDRGLPPGRGGRRRQARAPWPHPDRLLQGPREDRPQTFPVVDGVRWSVPGDDARIETDGTITVLGRGSVSINTGGEKVYPEEVEARAQAEPRGVRRRRRRRPRRTVGRTGRRRRRAPRRRRRAVARSARRGLPANTSRATRCRATSVYVDHVVRSPSGKPDYRWAKQTAMRRLGITEPPVIPAP